MKIRAALIDTAAFQEAMGVPSYIDITNSDDALRYVVDQINKCAAECKKTTEEPDEINKPSLQQNRWLNIPLKDLWASIGWNGLLETKNFNNQEQPKPQDFKRHFEELLYIDGEDEQLDQFQHNDAEISPETD